MKKRPEEMEKTDEELFAEMFEDILTEIMEANEVGPLPEKIGN